jgi:hypothetical protein
MDNGEHGFWFRVLAPRELLFVLLGAIPIARRTPGFTRQCACCRGLSSMRTGDWTAQYWFADAASFVKQSAGSVTPMRFLEMVGSPNHGPGPQQMQRGFIRLPQI